MQTINVQQAAHLMHKDPQFVRAGLRDGTLPFGVAIKVSQTRYSYYISPAKFYAFIGKEDRNGRKNNPLL